MGAYLTWQPGPHTTDADRNCISNIRPEGIGYADAAFKLAHMLRAMRARRLSGVQLKDDSDRLLAQGPEIPLRTLLEGFLHHTPAKTPNLTTLTTHTGPPAATTPGEGEVGRPPKAVDEVVAQQVASGIDIVSDGEMSKPSYTTYIRHRVDGIEHGPARRREGPRHHDRPRSAGASGFRQPAGGISPPRRFPAASAR